MSAKVSVCARLSCMRKWKSFSFIVNGSKLLLFVDWPSLHNNQSMPVFFFFFFVDSKKSCFHTPGW